MRSQLRHRHLESRSNPLVQCVVEAISALAGIFILIGDLFAPTSHTRKKSDRSEPPDARLVVSAA